RSSMISFCVHENSFKWTRKLFTAGQCSQSRLPAFVDRFDGQPAAGTEAPAACVPHTLSIHWRLNRVVWISGKKLGKRDQDRFSPAQRIHTTDDRDHLACRSQPTLHQRHLPVGEGALNRFEGALVKLCESHYRTSCASWRSTPAFSILSAALKMRCALRSRIAAPASQF